LHMSWRSVCIHFARDMRYSWAYFWCKIPVSTQEGIIAQIPQAAYTNYTSVVCCQDGLRGE
jgi:hypothetical protein